MSKDDKSNKKSGKGNSHPDFDELLKQEQERMKAVQPEADEQPEVQEPEMPAPEMHEPEEHDLLKDHDDLSAELDDMLDSTEFDHHEFDEPMHDHPTHDEPVHEDPIHNVEHEEELKDLEHALSDEDPMIQSSGDSFEEQFGAFDDSTEFNLDDDDEESGEPKPEAQKPAQNKPKKSGGFLSFLSGGLVFYAIIALIVFGGGYFLFNMIFGSHHPVEHRQVVHRSMDHNVGFHPAVQQKVVEKQKLPPAVPQTLQKPKTVVMGNTPNEILNGSGAHLQRGANGITLLQVNKQQLAKLLDNFQKTVKENNKQVVSEVNSLKSSLGSINKTQGKTAEAYTSKLRGINSQIGRINQKFDAYNKHMSSINKALTKTQAQLKLILAERAENIQRYTLRAIVPGRAWLVNDEGKTITLKIGETLRDYGKVVEINNKMGFVKMSSGFVFK